MRSRCCSAGRHAGTPSTTGRLTPVRAACAAGDWDQAAGVLAGSAVGIVMSEGARPLESVLGLFPAGRAGDAAVAAAWASARLWSADAEGAAAYLEAAARAVERAAAATRRVVEPGAGGASDPGRGRAAPG